MVHLNGRAFPELPQTSDSSSSTLYDDVRHVSALDDNRQRRHAPVSEDAALVKQTSSPRRASSSHKARGPKPLLPRSLKEALQLAELLSKSKLVPKGFETPETCLVGILYGMEVGLSPIAALQRMAVIDGRPTIWGDAALALVQASGLLQSIKEDVIDDHSDDSTTSLTAICIVMREGRSEPIKGNFSVEDANRAGLWQKPGPWTDYPKRMLIMRARAFALRDAFPDVLAGLYIREEFEGAEKRQSRAPQAPSAVEAECNAVGSVKKGPETKPSDFEGPRTDPHTESSSSSNFITEPILDDRVTKTIRRAPTPPPPAPAMPQPSTQENSDTVDEAPTATGTGVTESRDIGTVAEQQYQVEAVDIEQSYPTTEEPRDPETDIDLLDSALCCALDRPTLEEIVDDFALRLNGLDKDYQKRAHRIIDRHQRRVENLDRFALSQAYGSQVTGGGIEEARVIDITKDTAGIDGTYLQTEVTDGGPVDVHRGVEDHVIPAADLPRGLKAILPTLGLGSLPMTALRRRRRNTSRHSLSSWNAHQRLREFKLKTRDEVTGESEQSESVE